MRGTGPSSLRKGMTREAVESLLGKPSEVTDKEQGGLKITSCTFQRKDATVHAEFVSDVLIRYTLSSNKRRNSPAFGLCVSVWLVSGTHRKD